VSPSSPQ